MRPPNTLETPFQYPRFYLGLFVLLALAGASFNIPLTPVAFVNVTGALLPLTTSLVLLWFLGDWKIFLALPIAVWVGVLASGIGDGGILIETVTVCLFSAATALVLLPKSPVLGAYGLGTLGAFLGGDMWYDFLMSHGGAMVPPHSMEIIGGGGLEDAIFTVGPLSAIFAAALRSWVKDA